MNKNILLVIGLIVLLIVAGYVFSRYSLPQTSEKIQKVGIIVRGKSYEAAVGGFKAKMNELGYEEGKNILYNIQFVNKREDLPGVVKAMLDDGVELLHTYSTPATIEAFNQTKIVPIVFGSMGDPIASGLVQTLQKPGLNVTGISSLSVDTVGKRMEYVKQLVPSIRRVAFAFTESDIPARRSYEEAIKAAPRLGLVIVPYYITPERSVQETAAAIFKKDVDAIVISSDSATWANLVDYIAQAKKEKLPFSVFDKDMVEKGGLVGYGPDYAIVGGQAALLVSKILKGAIPGDLPVESPNKFILAINLKTAEENGITISDSFLSIVDFIVR